MEYAHHHLKMKNLLSIQIFYGKKLNSMDLLGDLNSVEDTFTHNSVQGYAA